MVGRPINVQFLGDLNLPKLYKQCTPEQHWQTCLVIAESLTREVIPATTKIHGRQAGSVLVILDLKGFGLSQFWQMKSIVQKSFQISQDYYPETMGTLAFINAPSTITMMWSAIKPWLAKETQEKIVLFGKDYKERLLELVDVESLPKVLGGACTCQEAGGCHLSGAGPWLDNRKGWEPRSQLQTKDTAVTETTNTMTPVPRRKVSLSSLEKKLKEDGNQAFKAGLFHRAEELYGKAEKIDSENAFYPSNLSAALFEQAKYLETIQAIERSYTKLSDEETKRNLLPKLSTRLAKSLAFGARSGVFVPENLIPENGTIHALRLFSDSEVATSDCKRAWDEWRRVERNLERVKDGEKSARTRLVSIPVRKRTPQATPEYYLIGNDEPMSICEDWGSNEDEKRPLNLSAMSREQLARIAIFIGGTGDARHLFGSILGLGRIHQSLEKKKKKAMKVHITANDIHPTAIARELCLFLLLDELASSKDDETKEAELKMTLLCMWFSFVMPRYCYQRLEETMNSLRARLQRSPPDLPSWLHLSSSAVPAILNSLDYWVSRERESWANHVLKFAWKERSPVDGLKTMNTNNSLSSSYTSRISDTQRKREESARQFVENMSESELIKYAAKVGLPPCPRKERVQERRQWMTDSRKMIIDAMFQVGIGDGSKSRAPVELAPEIRLHEKIPTFAPPPILRSRHTSLAKFWDQERKMKSSKNDDTLGDQAYEDIKDTWRMNISLYDKTKPQINTDVVNAMNNVIQIHVYNQRKGLYDAQNKIDPDCPAYSILGVFFDALNVAIAKLKDHLTIELLMDDCNAALSKIRNGDRSDRPTVFPARYTRIWLSNIPDYTGGPLATSVFVMPSLEDSPECSVAANCLLNSGIWESGDHYVHNYTLLSCRDWERFFGGRVIAMKPAWGITEFASEPLPIPLNKLPSRVELQTWLSRVLIAIVTPGGKGGLDAGMHAFRAQQPFTLAMFIRLLIRLHEIGYPPHWLADYLQIVLHDDLRTDVVVANGQHGIPLSEMGKRGPSRKLNLHPWRTEFETILALSYEAIPFPLVLPADFAQVHTEIATFEAPTPVLGMTVMMGMHAFDPSLSLIFFKSGRDLPPNCTFSDILEGRQTTKGDVYVVTAVDQLASGIATVRWRMARARVRKMQQEGWKLLVFRHDFTEQSVTSIPSSQWREVRD
ncbi:hypothetical protein VNI00_002552 [Paramarasmius palmivorus]|uniref:CRAL-TRIO domain-containing protein n=1 Tax=Paramarasmius palmivorus TaxID=297713 RepID=A0AAW0E1J4_9AGAR